jgi:hypothetical protein
VQLAHERAWHGNAFKRLGLGQSASNPRLIEQLEAENSQLRSRLMDSRLKHCVMHSAVRSLRLRAATKAPREKDAGSRVLLVEPSFLRRCAQPVINRW